MQGDSNYNSQGKSLPAYQQAIYASPTVGVHFLMGPMAIIQGIYATYFGISLTSIATIMLVARLFDAFSDPTIGIFSDRSYKRSGSRKSFIVLGGILMVVSSYFLFVPVQSGFLSGSTKVSESYFLVCILFFYFSYTLFEIPHLAWGGELAATSADKSSIYSLRAAAFSLGGMLFYMVPLLPIFDTNEITPQTLKWAAFIGCILILPALMVGIKKVPNRYGAGGESEGKLIPIEKQAVDISNRYGEKSSPKSKLPASVILSNFPLLMFLSAYLIIGISLGMNNGLFFIYVNSYLGMGDDYAMLAVCSMLASVISARFWYWLVLCLGKKLTWALGSVGLGITGFLITAALQPGEVSFLHLLLIGVATGCGSAAGLAVAPSVLSDIGDYSEYKFGVDCSASLFSCYLMVLKASGAVGLALGFFVAGWFGFDPSATVYSEDAVFGLRLAAIWIPICVVLTALVFIALMPINEKRHATIRRCLERRHTKSRRYLASSLAN